MFHLLCERGFDIFRPHQSQCQRDPKKALTVFVCDAMKVFCFQPVADNSEGEHGDCIVAVFASIINRVILICCSRRSRFSVMVVLFRYIRHFVAANYAVLTLSARR